MIVFGDEHMVDIEYKDIELNIEYIYQDYEKGTMESPEIQAGVNYIWAVWHRDEDIKDFFSEKQIEEITELVEKQIEKDSSEF